MRIRKSGLGGYFCQLSNGKTLRLSSCVDCGSLLLKFKPLWLQRDKESLNELYDSGVCDWSGSTYGRDELICTECMKEIDSGDNYAACTSSPRDYIEDDILTFKIRIPDYMTIPEAEALWLTLWATAQGYADRLWIDKGLHKTEKL